MSWIILKNGFVNFRNVVVNNEFGWKQPKNPIVLQKIDVSPKILFENGIQNFRLSISFWVVNREKVCFYPESRDQLVLNIIYERSAPVTNYKIKKPWFFYIWIEFFFAVSLAVIPSMKMHLIILFSLFIITMVLIQFLLYKSRFTNKSTIKSIKMWNHRLFGTGKSFKVPWYLSRQFLVFFATITISDETFDVI